MTQLIFFLSVFVLNIYISAGATPVSLADVLAFWTGASQVPPLGFPKQLEVSFMRTEKKLIPSANTCGMVLHLWIGYSDIDVFQSDF